jgi:predicted naringenin-chalcone synthase
MPRVDSASIGIELLHAEVEVLAVQAAKFADAVAAAVAAGNYPAELRSSGQELKALAARLLVDADDVAGYHAQKKGKGHVRQ